MCTISLLAQAIGTFFPWSVAKTPWLLVAYAELRQHIVRCPQQVTEPACTLWRSGISCFQPDFQNAMLQESSGVKLMEPVLGEAAEQLTKDVAEV